MGNSEITGGDVARNLDASLRATSLTDSGNDQFKDMQRQLNAVLGTNLEVDGYATLRANRGADAENITRLSNTQTAIAEFIDQYAPELLGRSDLTVDNLLGAIEEAAELKQQGLLQKAVDRASFEAAAPVAMAAAPVLSQPQDIPSVADTIDPPVDASIAASIPTELDVPSQDLDIEQPFAPPPVEVMVDAPTLQTPDLPVETVVNIPDPQLDTVDIGTISPDIPSIPDIQVDVPNVSITTFAEQIMPDEDEAAHTDFYQRLEERAAGTDWQFDGKALALEASIYAVNNMDIEDALEITQANADGFIATVLHKVLESMNILEPGSPHEGFFDAVYVDGRSVEDATSEFGEDARLAHEIQETLIQHDLLNIGDGTVEIEVPHVENDPMLLSQSDALPATADVGNAFDTALMSPADIDSVTLDTSMTPQLTFGLRAA